MQHARPFPTRVEAVDDVVVEILRRKGPADKLRMITGGWPLLRAMHATQLRRDHPDWDEAQVQTETSRRMIHGST